MRAELLKAMKDLRFITGLKQIEEYSQEEKIALLDLLENHVKSHKWMNVNRLSIILKNGMEGGYGDFKHLNVKTLATWCGEYKKNNAGKLQQEVLAEEATQEASEEEKQYWLEVGKQTFRAQWEESKTGYVPQLSLWGPYFFDRFIEKGLLKESNYKVSEDEIRKNLRITREFVDVNSVMAIKKDRVWRLFIKDMIDKKIDLTQYL